MGKMTRLLVILVSLLFVTVSQAADSGSVIRGDAHIYEITRMCDAVRLKQFAAALKPGQQRVHLYRYTMYFKFKDGKLVNTALEPEGDTEPESEASATDLPPDVDDIPYAVRRCIITEFLRVARFRAPANGTIPFRVFFPVVIVSRKK